MRRRPTHGRGKAADQRQRGDRPARAGAEKVLGLDFATGMLKIARERAQAYGVAERCAFELGDFLTYPIPERFDYAIVMGFMDYVQDPRAIVDRVLDIVSLDAAKIQPVEALRTE